MSVSTGNLFGAEERTRWVAITRRFTVDPAPDVQAGARIDVLDGEVEGWTAGFGFAKGETKIALSILDGSTVLARQERELARREVVIGGARQQLSPETLFLTCTAEFPWRSRRTLSVQVRLIAHAVAGHGGASAWSAVNVPSLRIERCCPGALEPREDGLVALRRWFSPGRKDNATLTAWQGCADSVRKPDYEFSHDEGLVSSVPGRGLVPLYHWYSPGRKDNFLTPRHGGRPGDMLSPDYRFVRRVGYIHDPAAPQPDGTVGLYGWYSPEMKDNLVTTRHAGRRGDTLGPDYRFSRLLGYVNS